MDRVLVDSSYLYALYSPSDNNYQLSQAFAATNAAVALIPDVVLPEVAFLFKRAGGVPAVAMFIEKFILAQPTFEPVTIPMLKRAREIMLAYSSARFELVDCCIMSLAEILNIRQVCTYDRRDFSIFRPRHCEYLELLP